MSAKEQPEGWGLSSEQYDEDKVLEVDTRSVDYEELRKEAKDPHATWSEGTGAEDPEQPTDHDDPPAAADPPD